ncbi:MAG: hypothetical protein EB105_01575 [Actinobacteria bacterium]|nr:hypothetical protein [Actinomycetota bacterium]
MHEFDEEIDALAAKILEYSLVRLKKDPPLDGPWTYDELYAEVGETITENGIGGEKALDIFKHVLAKACISTDHPRYLRADSLIVDPHKWLFAPFDACALIYRNPEIARKAHTQEAGYLEPLSNGEWNPSDYAIHLTRRTRGLPLWFSLAVHGTKKYAEAMDKTMDLAREAAALIKEHPNLELLLEPTLSIVAFTRIGWSADDYQKWSDKLLNDQIGFVTPSSHEGKPILRFAIVNPWTSIKDIKIILATL